MITASTAYWVKLTRRFTPANSETHKGAIPSRRHTHNVAKDLREVTLVGKAAAYSSLKNSDSGMVKKIPSTLNPSSEYILMRWHVN